MSLADALDRGLVSSNSDRVSPAAWIRPHAWTIVAAVLFSVYLWLIFATFRDYGVTFDEDVYHTYGYQVFNWYLSGFRDASAVGASQSEYYSIVVLNHGGFFAVLLELAARILPFGEYQSAHLVNALFALLGVFAAYRLARLMGGPAAGTLAALFLILIPRFYGHSFNNAADLPLATLSAFTLYYLARVIQVFPRLPRDLIAKLGLAIGLSMAVRIGMLLLLGYTALALVMLFAGHYLLAANTRQRLWAGMLRITKALVAVCAIAFVVMTAFWPAAMARPIIEEIRAIRSSTQFEFPFNLLFEGRIVSNAGLPWYYVPKWFLITLPEFMFIALGAGVVICGAAILRRRIQWRHLFQGRPLTSLILVVSVALPVGYAVATNPPDYDEIRHFLFVVPSLAVLAGISAALVLRQVRTSWLARAAAAAVVASMAITAVDMWQLHPYQYVFFNRLFGGGVAQASTQYEMDYWGSSFKEGVDWLVHDYAAAQPGQRVKVASCLYSLSTSYYLPSDRFEYLGSYDKGMAVSGTPDVFLASTRWGCDQRLDGPVIHVVSREGAPLLYIKQIANPSLATNQSSN